MASGVPLWTTCGTEPRPVWCAESWASVLQRMPCKEPSWVKVGEKRAALTYLFIVLFAAPKRFCLSVAHLRRHVCPGQSDNDRSGLSVTLESWHFLQL